MKTRYSCLTDEGRILCRNADCEELIPVGAKAGHVCACGCKALFIPACDKCGYYISWGSLKSEPCLNCGALDK